MRRPRSARPAAQVPDDRRAKRDAEDGGHAHVDADRRLDVPEPVDDVGIARVRPAGGDEGPREDDGERERGEREARPAQRSGTTGSARPTLERRASTATTTAAASTTIASRKCDMTAIGSRSSRS